MRATYTALRENYGFRVSNFSVDSDSASPARVLPVLGEACPSAPTSRLTSRSWARTSRRISVDDQQLCVEGLEHGDTYSITLRAGLPSTVDEALLKNAEFTIYVRDRSPSVRLAGKAYVLPKTGQQGIPLVSVNTDRLKVTIYRIGDRSLLDNVLGYDFERNL